MGNKTKIETVACEREEPKWFQEKDMREKEREREEEDETINKGRSSDQRCD